MFLILKNLSSGRSTFFERQQQMVQQPTPATPSNMSFALITVPEGATVTRCPAATGNDSDDVSYRKHIYFYVIFAPLGVWGGGGRNEMSCDILTSIINFYKGQA